MLLSNLLLLLLAAAVSNRREKSILYNRVAFIILLYSSLIGLESLDMVILIRGLSLYGGLFQNTSITLCLEIFIYLLGGIILQLTGSYAPRDGKRTKDAKKSLGIIEYHKLFIYY